MPSETSSRAIALDVMGGDNAPAATIAGAELARQRGIEEIILVGHSDELRAELARQGLAENDFRIVHAAQTVAMDESPAYALRRKKDASIAVATRLIKSGEAAGLVSAGSTGAQVASSILHLGRIPGVQRPAITVAIPCTHGWGALLDAGANSQNTPSHLVGFAVMGSLFIEHVYGVKNPRVGLVSIGEEATKGNELVVEAHKLLEKTAGVNFVGMIEGREVYTGGADVMVCDGFLGNILLKFSESASRWVVHHLRKGMRRKPLVTLGGLLMKPAFKHFRSVAHPNSVGGAPLIGVNGVSIIAHGSSDAEAIMNSFLMARRMVDERVNERIAEQMSRNGG